jgi:hypothetical protein
MIDYENYKFDTSNLTALGQAQSVSLWRFGTGWSWSPGISVCKCDERPDVVRQIQNAVCFPPSPTSNSTTCTILALCAASGGSKGNRERGVGTKNKTLQIEWNLEIKNMNEGTKRVRICGFFFLLLWCSRHGTNWRHSREFVTGSREETKERRMRCM